MIIILCNEGNSSMCDPQQKATEGHFAFIFGMNYTFLSFLIISLNLASNKWICIPWAYQSDAWVMCAGANWNEALQNFEKTVQSSPSSLKFRWPHILLIPCSCTSMRLLCWSHVSTYSHYLFLFKAKRNRYCAMYGYTGKSFTAVKIQETSSELRDP